MPKKMKIGVLVSHSGPAGLWGPSTDAAALLAASEINAETGVLGNEIELILADPGWNIYDAVAVVRDLVDLHGIHALVGMHPSNIRQAVKTELAGRLPYIYTPQYEGGEYGETTVATGGTDAALMRATLPWLVERFRLRRFCVLANNYIWPETALQTARTIIAASSGRIVCEALVPFGSEYHAEVELVRQSGADVVLTFLLGEELVRFNRAFGAAGLSGSVLRYALGLDENVLMGVGADSTENLFGAATFAANPASRTSMLFIERFRSAFGAKAPTVSVFGQSCYEGIHLAAALAGRAGSIDPDATTRFLRSNRHGNIRAILNPAKFDEINPIYLLRARDFALEPIKQDSYRA